MSRLEQVISELLEDFTIQEILEAIAFAIPGDLYLKDITKRRDHAN